MARPNVVDGLASRDDERGDDARRCVERPSSLIDDAMTGVDGDATRPIDEMRVVDLRAALLARGLPADGLKATLRARLEESIAAAAGDDVARGDDDEEDEEDEDASPSDAEDDADDASEDGSSSGEEVDDALARRIRASASKDAASRDEGRGFDEEAEEEAEEEEEDDSDDSDEASSSEDANESESESESGNSVEEDCWRRPGDPTLHETLTRFVAKSVETRCKVKAYLDVVTDPSYVPTEEDKAHLERVRQKLIETYSKPLPTLEDEVRKQEERRRKELGGLDGIAPKHREDALRAMPTDGWNRERKKERTKMKKNDPSAQGTSYATRKLIEEGAGLFVAPQDQTKVRREMRKMERKTAGKGWFDMKAVEYTPELRREMRMLKLRGAYDPKRFYKNADTSKLPTHFQVGTVVGGAADFYSARLAKKDQKRTLAEEVLHDKDIERVRRGRFAKIQEQNAGNMGRKAKRRLGGRAKGKFKKQKV